MAQDQQQYIVEHMFGAQRAKESAVTILRPYILMCEYSLNEAAVLDEIMFWFTPNEDGSKKTRVNKDGYDWVAISRTDWMQRKALTPNKVDHAVKMLVERGFIVTGQYKFNGRVTTHFRPNFETLAEAYLHVSPSVQRFMELHQVPPSENSDSTPVPSENSDGPSENSEGPSENSETHIQPSHSPHTTPTKPTGSGDPAGGRASLFEPHSAGRVLETPQEPDEPETVRPTFEGTPLEEFLVKARGWRTLPKDTRDILAAPSFNEDRPDDDLPSPNELFDEDPRYKGWIDDSVIPWFERKAKGGGSFPLAKALQANYDWFLRWSNPSQHDSEYQRFGDMSEVDDLVPLDTSFQDQLMRIEEELRREQEEDDDETD